MERHQQLVEVVESYAFQLNRHNPEHFHDTIYSRVHDLIRNFVEHTDSIERWCDYSVDISRSSGVILTVSRQHRYDLGRHKDFKSSDYSLKRTESLTPLYPSFILHNQSPLLPIKRETTINYLKGSDTKLKITDTNVLECRSTSSISLGGTPYKLDVSTWQCLD